MFFTLSKILVFLTDPLFLLLCFFLLLGLTSKYKKTVLVVFSVFYLLSTPFISQRLLYRLEHLEEPSNIQGKYDAVIVLSGMIDLQNSDSSKIEFSEGVDRILAGVRLIRSNKADFLILSGGSGSLEQNDGSEAVLLADFARWLGIKEEKILLDTISRNTYENAVNTSKLSKEKGFLKLLLVTSAFHMQRAKGCFEKQGVRVDVLPVDYRASLEISDFTDFLPSTDSLYKTNLLFHEVVGILVYAVTGKSVI